MSLEKQQSLLVLTMATATTKFGFRHWSSQGELRTEYWITDLRTEDDGVAGSKSSSSTSNSTSNSTNIRNSDSTDMTKSDSTDITTATTATRDDVAVNFTAGSLQALYRNSNRNRAESAWDAHVAGNADLILALQ